MRVILLGAPGAGKGTIARELNAHDGSVPISTGDILRAAVKAGTALGEEARAFMERGELVPDELILGMMEQRLREPDAARGFLLDGFPRTIPQAEALDALLAKLRISLDLVVNLDVPREVLLDRLTTRRTCSNAGCQEIYNVKTKPPAPGGACSVCGATVVQRADETEAAISRRLDTHDEKTAPLAGYYARSGKMLTVTSLTRDEAVSRVIEALGARR